MEKESTMDSKKTTTLEEATKKGVAQLKSMSKEEAIAHFKSIGMLTENGEFAPQFQNLKHWRPAS